MRKWQVIWRRHTCNWWICTHWINTDQRYLKSDDFLFWKDSAQLWQEGVKEEKESKLILFFWKVGLVICALKEIFIVWSDCIVILKFTLRKQSLKVVWGSLKPTSSDAWYDTWILSECLGLLPGSDSNLVLLPSVSYGRKQVMVQLMRFLTPILETVRFLL